MIGTAAGYSVGKLQAPNLLHDAHVKPNWADTLHWKFRKYSMTYLLDKLGYVDYTGNKELNWSEIGRTRSAQTTAVGGVTIGDGLTNTTVEVVETDQYFVVRDTIILPSGRVVQVSNVAIGPPQTLTVQPIDGGTPLVLADFGTLGTSTLGHLGNLQEECYTIPSGREFKAASYSNKFSKLHTNKGYCDDTVYEPLWYKAKDGKEYWYYAEQFIQAREHLRDVELTVLKGELSSSVPSGANMAKGVLTYVEEAGSRSTIAAGPTEDDIIDQIALMRKNADVKAWIAFVGTNYMTSATKALSSYHESGAQFYGNFGPTANEIGLNFQHYRFNDCVVNFTVYDVFNDPTGLGSVEAVDYGTSALFLALGNDDSGQKLVELVYRESPWGEKIKMLYSWASGHMSHPQRSKSGNQRSLNTACFEEDYSTQVSVRMRGLNNHGVQLKT